MSSAADDHLQPTKSPRSLARLAPHAILGLGFFVVIVFLYFVDRFHLQKLLTDLCMPLGLLWMLVTVLTVELLRRRLMLLFCLSMLAWSVCFIAGNNLVAARMVRLIEGEYYTTDPLAVAPLDTVVLLGGGASDAPNGQVQANQRGDRVVLAARLYHQGLARRIICTGMSIKKLDPEKLDPEKLDTGQIARLLLLDMGVPAASIETIGGRNTAEEMQAIAQHLDTADPVGIVTSAWHLPRAMRLARRAGISAVPLPCNFLSGRPKTVIPVGEKIRNLVPNHSALADNSAVIKELLAGLVNR